LLLEYGAEKDPVLGMFARMYGPVCCFIVI